MKKIKLFITILIFILSKHIIGQKQRTDANIVGHVTCCDEHIPFATVSIKGTTIGTTTDETGHYQLINLPEGTHILKAQLLGYKPKEKEVTIKAGETKEVKFELEKDVLGLEEVVITGNRNETNRKESSTIISTITPKQFDLSQSITISEGLNYCPGLRTENNCQNCGFTQVRMNGMEGSYSQVLINNRPIFSGLAGVYGLELIPTNMIERVEVIRGGGSALYGSNAIAGTINLVLKDPIFSSYEFDLNHGLIGVGVENAKNPAKDFTLNFNSSLISSDNKTGMSLYGFYRDRDYFDANDDGFSEISTIQNTTLGGRVFHRFGAKNKLSGDFFTIKEDRRGGNKFQYPKHQADIAEAVDHNILSGALTYEQFVRKVDLLSIYASGQGVNRDSYYGAEQSLKDYGATNDFSYITGAQYNADLGVSGIIAGVENQGAWLNDKKLGYPIASIGFTDSTMEYSHTSNRTIANQETNTLGVFAQYELNWEKLKISAGARYDNFQVMDNISGSNKKGDVISPRLTFKYDIQAYLQARISYSQGYRAPQVYDEDLHIETSGARKVIHVNDPNLEKETSHSYLASLDFNKKLDGIYLGLLVEGFYTRLIHPFANEFTEPNEQGTVIYTRVNAKKGANVRGVNIEMNTVPSKNISIKSGFTMQLSEYEEEQEFGETKFFRTPNDYGFITMDCKLSKAWKLSSTANYTGKMLVPYFGPELPNPAEGELRETNIFFDLGMKIKYSTRLNGATLQLFTGAKNIFNSYQDDFDSGINRDPAYIYGPLLPRTVYFGIKIGNKLERN